MNVDTLVIMHGYLCQSVDTCTCGYGGYPYGHEPGCGLEPLIRLDQISGWHEEYEHLVEAIREEVKNEISVHQVP